MVRVRRAMVSVRVKVRVSRVRVIVMVRVRVFYTFLSGIRWCHYLNFCGAAILLNLLV